MGEFVLQLKSQTLDIWQRFSRTQKITIIAASIGILVALIVLTLSAAKPDYRPLFGEKLEPAQANAIVEKLKELNIPYRLSEGGDSILVPAQNLAETRLAVAGDETLPMGGVVGFEAFDEPRFGETETDRQAKYLRALQGELTRTIEHMNEVEKARVHVVLPAPSLFSEAEKAATAAIVLKLAPNKTLGEEQVHGLIKLVSSSVEGLDPGNITIVDTNSNILSEVFDPEGLGETSRNQLTATQMQMRLQYQKDIERSVQSMLERVLGPGKAVVRANAMLNFDSTKLRKETHGKPLTVSKHEIEERVTGENGLQGGVAGTDSNVAGIPQYPSTQGGTFSSERTETTINNHFDREEQETIKAPGEVEKLSVAVVLDGTFNPAQQQQLENLVVSAAGLDKNRGDQVSVLGMPFETSSMEEISAAMAADQKLQEQILYSVIAAIILTLVGGIIFFALRKYKQEQEEANVAAGQAVTVEELLAAHAESTLEQDQTVMEPQSNQHLVHIEKLSKEKPEETARLLKTWLAED